MTSYNVLYNVYIYILLYNFTSLYKLNQWLKYCHKSLLKHLAFNYFPNGLTNSIKDGSKVKTEIIANNIASPVKIPK